MKEFLQNLVEELQASEENNRSGLSKQMIKSAMKAALEKSNLCYKSNCDYFIVEDIMNSLDK